eukprot:Rmarinus@m.19517
MGLSEQTTSCFFKVEETFLTEPLDLCDSIEYASSSELCFTTRENATVFARKGSNVWEKLFSVDECASLSWITLGEFGDCLVVLPHCRGGGDTPLPSFALYHIYHSEDDTLPIALSDSGCLPVLCDLRDPASREFNAHEYTIRRFEVSQDRLRSMVADLIDLQTSSDMVVKSVYIGPSDSACDIPSTDVVMTLAPDVLISARFNRGRLLVLSSFRLKTLVEVRTGASNISPSKPVSPHFHKPDVQCSQSDSGSPTGESAARMCYTLSHQAVYVLVMRQPLLASCSHDQHTHVPRTHVPTANVPSRERQPAVELKAFSYRGVSLADLSDLVAPIAESLQDQIDITMHSSFDDTLLLLSSRSGGCVWLIGSAGCGTVLHAVTLPSTSPADYQPCVLSALPPKLTAGDARNTPVSGSRAEDIYVCHIKIPTESTFTHFQNMGSHRATIVCEWPQTAALNVILQVSSTSGDVQENKRIEVVTPTSTQDSPCSCDGSGCDTPRSHVAVLLWDQHGCQSRGMRPSCLDFGGVAVGTTGWGPLEHVLCIAMHSLTKKEKQHCIIPRKSPTVGPTWHVGICTHVPSETGGSSEPGGVAVRLMTYIFLSSYGRDALLRNVIVFDSVRAAHVLCHLNEWDTSSTRLHALQDALRQRHVGLVADSVIALKSTAERESAAKMFVEFVSGLNLLSEDELFACRVVRIAISVLSALLLEHQQKTASSEIAMGITSDIQKLRHALAVMTTREPPPGTARPLQQLAREDSQTSIADVESLVAPSDAVLLLQTEMAEAENAAKSRRDGLSVRWDDVPLRRVVKDALLHDRVSMAVSYLRARHGPAIQHWAQSHHRRRPVDSPSGFYANGGVGSGAVGGETGT